MQPPRPRSRQIQSSPKKLITRTADILASVNFHEQIQNCRWQPDCHGQPTVLPLILYRYFHNAGGNYSKFQRYRGYYIQVTFKAAKAATISPRCLLENPNTTLRPCKAESLPRGSAHLRRLNLCFLPILPLLSEAQGTDRHHMLTKGLSRPSCLMPSPPYSFSPSRT